MKKYYLIDHKILFLFGYFFYFLGPYWVGTAQLFSGFPGIELYQGYFSRIPEKQLFSYLWITLSWIVAFFLGHFAFKLIKPYKRTLERYPATLTSAATSWLSWPLFTVLLLFTFMARGSLFNSYNTYDVAARGKMSTLLVIYNFFLIYQLVTKQRISCLLIAGISITSLLLLSMGGRMYFFQTLLAFLIFKTSFSSHRWKFSSIAVFALAGIFIATFVGVSRMGASFGFEQAGYSLMAEPAFTWFSTGSFLIENDIPVINIPLNFITSFLNLIPNSVLGLRQYVISVPAMGYKYVNPLGADSLWTTLVINFGSAGSFFFIFITGFMLSFLRHLSENNRFWSVYYIMVCSMIPFQLFRDGFFILNKQLFFNFLLLPGGILLLVKLIIFSQGVVRTTLSSSMQKI